jgi:CheY-like chemotaxis protein
MQQRVSLSGMRVLVLEDEVDTRNLLCVVLESHGAVAIATGSVPEAIAMVTESGPDVVLADIGMPDYNGYAFIAAVRKHEQPDIRAIPVIALTQFSTAADRNRALASGFSDYLAKPFDPAELLRTIKRLYDEHHAYTRH